MPAGGEPGSFPAPPLAGIFSWHPATLNSQFLTANPT
jgi:hypothetical protein